jgi:hypothetical protein
MSDHKLHGICNFCRPFLADEIGTRATNAAARICAEGDDTADVIHLYYYLGIIFSIGPLSKCAPWTTRIHRYHA